MYGIKDQRHAAEISRSCVYILNLDRFWTAVLEVDRPDPDTDAGMELVDVGLELANGLTYLHEQCHFLYRMADQLHGFTRSKDAEVLDQFELPIDPLSLGEWLERGTKYLEQHAAEEVQDLLSKIEVIKRGDPDTADISQRMRGWIYIIGGVTIVGSGFPVVAVFGPMGMAGMAAACAIGSSLLKQGLADVHA
ncbi:hypothetical protein [Streptomyces sp. UNOB3_S3]|uniref:hypothetical protein n=1 Tax=Streptomyces sp. UNOB3_S3 TaxID=2871682 RepID=UPI001E54A7C3|nr:hypothetical protein [Streptomyces sp. UNOB3_S3]MCC3773488.1 hypothetical protein [Streptomyces sp. UNOB3_S3]